MKTALIISGGDFSSLPVFFKFDICIACDKGYVYAERLGIRPDIIIGDFDSASKPLNEDIPIICYPKEKDDTDTMLAIKYALEQKFEHIVICCGLGKRLDHTLANLQSLAYIAKEGGIGELISDTEHVRTLSGNTSLILPRKAGYSLSLFSVTDNCEGISISGAEYNITDATVSNTFPIGCSNGWAEENVTISMQKGILLIIESKME